MTNQPTIIAAIIRCGLPALLFLAVLHAVAMAAPGLDFIRLFDAGQVRHERFEDVYHRAQGGYYVCGSSNGRSWLLSLSDEGETVWSVIEGRAGNYEGDVYSSVIETDEGEALVGGKIGGMFNATLRDKDNGETIWSRNYLYGWCEAVIELKSGEYALAGHDPNQGYITMIEPDGNPIWEFYYRDQDNITTFRSIRETDGGVVAVGDAGDGGFYDNPLAEKAVLIKVDFQGDLIWSREFMTRENRFNERITSASSLVSSTEGGFTFGFTRQHSGTGSQFGLTMVDERGENSDAQVFIHRESSEKLSGINKLSDGGYVMVGAAALVTGQGIRESYRMTRTNRHGDLLWSSAFENLVEGGWPGNPNIIFWWLRSVIVQENDQIVTVGEWCTDVNDRTSDAVLMRFEPDQLSPIVIYRSPEDSLIDILRDSSVDFIVRAISREGWEMEYEWSLNDSAIGDDDTTTTIRFDELGVDTVSCRLSSNEFTTETGWIVTVTDLFIASHSPDTLDLTLGRCPVNFSIDSVAAINRDGLTHFWSVSFENKVVAEIVDTNRISFDFNRSGNYRVEGVAYIPDGPQDNVVWDLAIRGAIWSFEPETTELTGILDTTVQFMIFPTVSDSLNWYTWLYNGGMIREGWDSTFAMNFFELGEHTITGILTDSIESDSVTWTVLVESNSVPDSNILNPLSFILSAFPNPFNSMLTIRFSTGSQAAPTRLAVYDLSGREVARLLDSKSEIRNQKSEIVWNASGVPAGVYLIRLQSGLSVQTMKVVLLR